MSDRQELARLAGWVAADLDRRHYPYAGVLRRAARALLEVPEHTDDDHCQGCGEPLDQPDTGRRRKWHDEACRSRARRR